MKFRNLVLICSLVGISVTVYGQGFAAGKGATMISGMGSFSTTDSEIGRTTEYTLTPSLDYFIFDHFFVGGRISYGGQISGYSNSSLNIGPEIGFAFGRQGSTAFPYLNAGWNYQSNVSNSYGSVITTGSGLSLGLGIIFPVKSHIGLALEGKFNTFGSPDSDFITNTFSLNFGIVGLLF